VEFPGAAAVDHVNQRLFVVDNATGASIRGVGSQIMVFDIHPDRIETGSPVIAVLGQPDVHTKTVGLARNHVSRARSVAVDDAGQRLFVGDSSNNRVLVFDIRPENFRTGMDADIVLGQKDFTSKESGLAPGKFRSPGSVVYDAKNQRLFVVDSGNARILVFDAGPEVLRTGASAIDVMGQPDFSSNLRRPGLDQFSTGGLTYDRTTDRLFIAESRRRIEHMRITVYDVAPGKSLRDAKPSIVLGKPGFGAYDPIVSQEQSVWPRLGASSIDADRQLLVATEGYPGGNRAIIWDISPDNLRTGAPAVEVVGHLNDEMRTDFSRRSANDRVNGRNVYPRDVSLDPIDHRLIAIDQYNNRVLVWQLDTQNRILDREARWVIGQPDLYTATLRPIDAGTIKIPLAVTYDSAHKRIFVSDGWGNRVMVFDAHPDRINNGANAIAALGQPDFKTTTPSRTRSGIDFDTRVGTGITPGRPRGTGLAYDPVHNRIFASDGGNHRVVVYDAEPSRLRTGMSAAVVIGQSDFTSGIRGLSASAFNQPAALLFDTKHQRLFVADGGNNRILVFNADLSVLKNGAVAIAVIGQPNFRTNTPLRSRNGIDGPDGLAYDYAADRLFVSDHGNDRVTIYDVSPDRLVNMPDALAVIGQQDFETRKLGPVRANELWDPRGLAFDSAHQRLYVSQGFAANIMVHDMARPTYEFDFPANGVQVYQSAGADPEQKTSYGYALATGANAGGAAVFTVMHTVFDPDSQRESRILVSETGVAVSPEMKTADLFVDSRAEVRTILTVTNPTAHSAQLRFVHRGTDGVTIGEAARDLRGSTSLTADIGELFDRTETGTVKVLSEKAFVLTAMRLTRNSRGEDIMTSIPVAHEPAGEEPLSFTVPRIEVGGGFSTQIVLQNPTDQRIGGTINFFSSSGGPFPVEGMGLDVPYSIAANGVFVWDSPADANVPETGFAAVSGATRPIVTGMVRLNKRGTLISESGAGGGSVTEAWFPIDTYPSVVRHGRTDFRVTLANGGAQPADLRLILYNPVGKELYRLNQILPPGRQLDFTQVDLADRGKFKGSLRIVSDLPVSITAHQLTKNVRNETIMTQLPSMRSNVASKGVIFPWFIDGPTIATQLFVLRKGVPATRGKIEFFDRKGQPLKVVLR